VTMDYCDVISPYVYTQRWPDTWHSITILVWLSQKRRSVMMSTRDWPRI